MDDAINYDHQEGTNGHHLLQKESCFFNNTQWADWSILRDIPSQHVECVRDCSLWVTKILIINVCSFLHH